MLGISGPGEMGDRDGGRHGESGGVSVVSRNGPYGERAENLRTSSGIRGPGRSVCRRIRLDGGEGSRLLLEAGASASERDVRAGIGVPHCAMLLLIGVSSVSCRHATFGHVLRSSLMTCGSTSGFVVSIDNVAEGGVIGGVRIDLATLATAALIFGSR